MNGCGGGIAKADRWLRPRCAFSAVGGGLALRLRAAQFARRNPPLFVAAEAKAVGYAGGLRLRAAAS